MRTIIRYGITGTALYLGINWIADNPKKFNYMRNQLNQSVDAGIEKGNEMIQEATR